MAKEVRGARKVLIYTTQTCPYCVMAKEFFRQHKIKFEEIDVGGDMEAAEEMIEKSGQMGVPVIEINGIVVVGFDTDALKHELELK